jgi:hypothetical protein
MVAVVSEVVDEHIEHMPFQVLGEKLPRDKDVIGDCDLFVVTNCLNI